MFLYNTVMQKLLGGEKGISTVISNILLVVITLIIASLLFLWVMSFTTNLEMPEILKPLFGRNEKENEKEKISIDFSVKKSNGNYTVTINYISKNIPIENIKYYLKDKSDKTVQYGEVSEILEKSSGNITFYDNDGNRKISRNDEFVINGDIVDEGTILKLKHAELVGGEVKLS